MELPQFRTKSSKCLVHATRTRANQVSTGSGDGLVPDGTKPSPGPMLTRRLNTATLTNSS